MGRLSEVDPSPIGIFDSGFGGLTIVRALVDLVPNESLVYFGDSARYPYGPRVASEVVGFSHQIAEYLISNYDVKMLIVACNTASSVALDSLKDRFSIPILGVIGPGARSAVGASQSGRLGVIGTVGTVASGAYQREIEGLDPAIELTCAACPGLVEFVEAGETDSEQVKVLASRLLHPIKEAKVDTLLLGCTHYPFLARVIQDVIGRDVVLISSAEETAFEVKELLSNSGLSSSEDSIGRYTFLSSGDPERFKELGHRLLGPELEVAKQVVWKGSPGNEKRRAPGR
ncbi:MAG: glutamate racemase [Actinomycetota bacterium]|nr:glutamate racemase [Actinomycetota bacterium]